ncbi:unnamed protein product [Cuscuta europaea]|uniref:Uncharacterized protein n=1 Tax=Cuscuta europaea TaxID=41803 RepID=A0A9P1EGG5_CUSEU|nr:unnamed protein product [Cuscuta europaea]
MGGGQPTKLATQLRGLAGWGDGSAWEGSVKGGKWHQRYNRGPIPTLFWEKSQRGYLLTHPHHYFRPSYQKRGERKLSSHPPLLQLELKQRWPKEEDYRRKKARKKCEI